MSKTQAKAARKERRQRRAKRNVIALKLAKHLLGAPALKPAELNKLLRDFIAVAPIKKGGAK